MSRILAAALASLLLILGLRAPARAGEPELDRARDALRVLAEIMEAPDRTLPREMLEHAEAVAVVPDVVKAGFLLGGRRGHGLIAVRMADGSWSNPAFIRLTGGSLGFQAGVSSTDVILVFRTRRGVDSIVNGKFTLGADAAVAAGPVGRSAQAATDAQLKAEIYSWSRTRGLFVGAALDGTALTLDQRANEAVYGSGATARRIFAGQVRGVPDAVVDFRDRLEESVAR